MTIYNCNIGSHMNKFAVGNDLVFIPSFEKSLTDLFKKKVYTQVELEYCDLFSNSVLRFASTWAAKEAVYKALKQIDKGPIGWNKIQIMRKKIAGEPCVTLLDRENILNISLTISHDGDYAWAVAIIYI